MDAGEANFVCPAGGVPCVVTVKVVSDPNDANLAITTITSVGGVATIRNSMAVMTTRAALFLNTESTGALNDQTDNGLTVSSVTRSTDGATTTITLTPSGTAGEFTSTEVDAGHANRYSGWSGQTFTRGGDVNLAMPEEATVYTNIKAATARKLTYGGTESTGGVVPEPSALVSFVLDDGQDPDASLIMSRRYGYDI